jgi:hypothetical protein
MRRIFPNHGIQSQISAARPVAPACAGAFFAGDWAGYSTRTLSILPILTKGGDLGSFGPGMMVPEFDKVVFSGEIGQVYGPVQTQFGYHLVEITSREG